MTWDATHATAQLQQATICCTPPGCVCQQGIKCLKWHHAPTQMLKVTRSSKRMPLGRTVACHYLQDFFEVSLKLLSLRIKATKLSELLDGPHFTAKFLSWSCHHRFGRGGTPSILLDHLLRTSRWICSVVLVLIGFPVQRLSLFPFALLQLLHAHLNHSMPTC